MDADRFRRLVSYATYRGLAGAIARAPHPVADVVAAGIGTALAYKPGGKFGIRERHMTRVLASGSPAVAPDPEVVRRWTRRAFRSYARYWVEGARLPTAPEAEVRRQMVMERGYQHLKDAMAAGQGIVLALPHVGAWEWGGRWLAMEGTPMTSVAERVEPPELFDWFVRIRKAMTLIIVGLGDEGAGSVVMRTLHEGGLVGLLCDRDLVGNGVAVDLFGERTTMPAGPATLALRTGATLMVGAVFVSAQGFHTAVVSAPLDTTRHGTLRQDVARLTQDIAHRFEDHIRQAPEQWHIYQPVWPSDRGE